MFIFEYPLGFVRKFTMPPSEKDNYDKILCIVWPFPGILFLFYGFHILTLENYLLYGVPSCKYIFIFLSFINFIYFYYKIIEYFF